MLARLRLITTTRSDLITHYQDTGINPIGEKVLINTYENANSSYNYGAELTSTDNIAKWWDLSVNLNIYNSKINTDNLKQPSQPSLWSYFGKFNSNFKLPANFTVQLTFIYQSKTNLPVNTNSQVLRHTDVSPYARAPRKGT